MSAGESQRAAAAADVRSETNGADRRSCARNMQRTTSMKLPIALATLFLAATAALPASARTPTGHSFYVHGGVARDTHPLGPARAWSPYRGGYGAYAATRGVRPPANRGWGHCISGPESELSSAYPAWDEC